MMKTTYHRSHKKPKAWTLYYGQHPVQGVQNVKYEIARAKELILEKSPNYRLQTFRIKPTKFG